MEVQLKETERIDDLQLKGLKLIQDTNGFCFGIDAVLLANFAKVKKGAKVVDLGTGTGIVPILIAGKSQASKIIGVEIQEEVYEMATRSVKLNDLEERVEIVNADIKEIKKEYEKIKQKTIEQVAANKASSLFKNLPNNLPKFFKQFTEEYREIPVFSRYDMNDLYKKLCDTPNYDLNNFVNILKVRYEKKKKMLKSDSRNLKKLSAIIRDNENDNNGSKILKTALLKNIADSIDNLLK